MRAFNSSTESMLRSLPISCALCFFRPIVVKEAHDVLFPQLYFTAGSSGSEGVSVGLAMDMLSGVII
jgi:hypothetical protein